MPTYLSRCLLWALCCASPVVLGAAESDGEDAVDSGEDDYDPWEGIEQDGRIPAVDAPELLKNPGRWRYVPEGRIKPGNIFQRFMLSTFIAPIVIFEEDVGGGGGLALTDIDFRQQRRREFLGFFMHYTSEGQQQYVARWRRWLHHIELPEGGVMNEERSFLRASAGYRRTLTRRFFGLGPERGEDDETSFTDEQSWIDLGFQHSLPDQGDDLLLAAGLRLEHRNLSRGHVGAVPSGKDAHPELFAEGDSRDVLWLNLGLAYDTRDSQHAPYRGWRVGAEADIALAQSGMDPGARLALDASLVFPVPGLFHNGGDADEEHPPIDTFALGAGLWDTVGDLPFYDLPSLGGSDTLRGFIGHRFTDRAAWHAGLEHRFWIMPRGFGIWGPIRVERLGLALFGELGSVADGVEELDDAEVQWSAGAGLRVSLERQAQFRFDLGVSEEDLNFLVAYGYSF